VKFRYNVDGAPMVEIDAQLPYNIPATADQTVTVEPIGVSVSSAGVVSGNVLSLAYDPSNPSQDVTGSTNTAGTLRWAITTDPTPPSTTEIAQGNGFYGAGNVATVAGVLSIELPALSGSSDLTFHAFVDGASADTNIASVRVYIGTASAYARIGSTTGGPLTSNYTDTDGTWRAYEFRTSGSFTVTTGGGIEYELIGGGGGGGGGGGYTQGGGGGAGGRLVGTMVLNPGTYTVVVGTGGAGGNGGTSAPTKGGDTIALDLTAFGGGSGGRNGGEAATSGGSGGGPGAGTSDGTSGTTGQGFGSPGGFGGGAAGNGGGGAAGAGTAATGDGDSRVGGNGGAGVQSSITGTAIGVAGGGGGSATTFGTGTYVAGTASHGGGAGGAAAADQGGAGAAATAPGGGGGGSQGQVAGGAGFRGRFVIRVKP
jgi:hypothetical protein